MQKRRRLPFFWIETGSENIKPKRDAFDNAGGAMGKVADPQN